MNKYKVCFKDGEFYIYNDKNRSPSCKVFDDRNLPIAISAVWKQLKFDIREKNMELDPSY